jgi:hypothetical protein
MAPHDAEGAPEELLTAVVLADPFGDDRRWGPLVCGNNNREGEGSPWVS